ncbi:MAG: DUF3800 domain-containing protein [Candidatus Bathyarchaeota archaeon]|nr:DUF3800 domain-containing protein [Candidatus Bathyarchaeota archaeon]
MYFLYIDESGSPNGWATQNHFVLGGVAIHEGQVAGLASKLDEIQTKYFGELKVPIEFHAGDIKTGNKRWRGILEKTRGEIMNDVYEVVANAPFPTLVAFGNALHISKAETGESINLKITFQDVCLSFNQFLTKMHKAGNTNKGLLIIDDAHKSQFRDLIYVFRKEGVEGRPIHNIVDIPYFSASQDTRMLQLADFCVYALYQYYEKNNEKYLEKILNKFNWRDSLHSDGVKHLIKKLDCTCIACSAKREMRNQRFLHLDQDNAIEPLGDNR